MWYGIAYNMIDIPNQLFFTYQGLILELQMFVSPPTKSTKTVNFICIFEKKQKVLHKMMTFPISL